MDVKPIRAALFAAIAAGFFTTAVAQDETSPEARQILLPDEFARFAPRTALDMARQVPGFPIDEGGQDRGFGQADTNILINGRRVSGKSNGPVDALSRIPADDVVRLEILDGASLDIGGLSGQVLNVVTDTGGGISGRYRYSPQYRDDGIPFRWGNGEISISGGSKGTEWTLSFANDQQKFGSAGPEFVIDGSGALIDTRGESVEEEFDQPGLAGSYTRVASNGNILNLTGEINGFLFQIDELSIRNPINDIANTRTLRETEDEFNFELGVDYEFDFWAGRLKLIALHRYEDSPTEARVDFSFVDNRAQEGSFFKRRAEEAETVLRTEFTFGALGGDWQWSLEGTHNFLDIDARLSVRDDTGTLAPVELPGASSRVEEDRYEMTISYSRPLTDNLQLQSSIGAEYSEISQQGEFGQTRDFVRPNGFASLNWRATDNLNVSLQVERQVGQLRFFDFISSVNVNQDRVNVTNADLVPPQSWLVDLQLQQSLGDYGSVTIGGFFEDISDIVDLIPIEGGGQAPGNIDSATRLGASLNTTLLSDPLGWRGARMDVEASYIDSDVADPLLGNGRRISRNDYIEYEIRFRQDIPGTEWAFGFELEYEEDAPNVRLDEVSVFRPSVPLALVFVEQKDFYGVTLRATVININDRSNDFFRVGFNDRVANDVSFVEERFRDFGTLFRLDIEGSF
ncbi:MAG: TonB-dependent receptor plug domain-containing protein [Pseudomonadota bacterium]